MSTVSLRSAAGRWVVTSSILASAMAFIDGTALNVVLPSLQRSLHASGAELFWVLNAYMLMLAALILLGGTLGDRLGRRRIFMTGIFIFMAGSAACGLAGTVFWLILFRVIQGIGGALMIPGSLSLISSAIDEAERGKAIGTWSSVTTLVTIGGPILGGALADAGLWRYIFFINIPIGVIALLCLWWKVKEQEIPAEAPPQDYPGAVLIVGGLALLNFGFLRMPVAGFDSLPAYGSIIAGLALLAAFVITEKRSRHPMLPLYLFNNRTFSGANLLTFFLYGGLSGSMLFLSLNMVQVQGYSQLESGLSFLPFTLLMVFLARLAGSMADKYGPRWFLIIGPLLAGTGMLLLSLVQETSGPASYWTTFFPGIFVLGLGMTLTVAPLTATVMGCVGSQLSGTASGVNNAVTRIAGVFAVAVFGAMAVLFFSGSMLPSLQNVSLTPAQETAVMAQTANLGNAAVPEGLSRPQQVFISHLYHQHFIQTYGKIMAMCGFLGWLGSIMAWIFIRKDKVPGK
ncbi:MFS transporter [Chitinophaga qingshengii]|uniref:MFS transporter n=1 Tax=Chitinophaga qingshengii TaxID=1569794 RepID=A0ABR7THP2_9BACT|nr:MFS transporter [Chitinophaga qingshengii]MBC9930023.1 MFS transporter [Chitinophaga qingshengii]